MRAIILFFLCLSSQFCSAQRVNISLDKKNQYLDKDFSNPITVLVEDCNCDEIELVGEGLEIKEYGYGQNEGPVTCKYTLLAKSLGKATLSIYDIRNNDRKLVDKLDFRVIPIHEPIAMVAGKSKGEISKNTLLAQLAIFAKLQRFPGTVVYKVTEFTVLIDLKHSNELIRKTFYSNRFTPELTNAIRKMEAGDEIYFLDIHYVGPGQTNDQLSSIVRLEVAD